MTDGPIYLDYNATTPLDPRVFEAMTPWFLTPSNAGSRTHSFGKVARDAVEKARQQVASVLVAKPEEVYFTSGATESNNIAILGLAEHGERSGRKHILSTAIEHKAVLEPLERLAKMGFEVELIPVTQGGYVEPDEVKARLRPDTLLVSVMHANNETGVLQPVRAIGEILADTDVLFHTDAAQTFGKEESLKDVLFDFASISAHKIYGPQGVGSLCIRRRKFLRPPVSSLAFGGGQERGLRPGTSPTASIVGLGLAAKLALLEGDHRKLSAIKTKQTLLSALESVEFFVNGDLARTQSHVLNLRFPEVDSEALMMTLRDSMAFSNGSACTSDSYESSHVLLAMGLSEEEANESIRLSWGEGIADIPLQQLIAAVSSMVLNL